MNKSLTILMAAMVLMILGVVVIAIFGGGLDSFVNSADNVENSGCQYQWGQLGAEDSENSDRVLSNKCNDGYDDEIAHLEAAEGTPLIGSGSENDLDGNPTDGPVEPN